MNSAIFRGEQLVKEWGNGLGIRVTAAAARAAHLAPGTPITLEVSDDGTLTVKSRPRLTLSQKLKLYDAAVHGGEVSTGGLVGKERF
jgi:antitoxin MazE